MSLTKATYSMIEGAPINILDFGADPTGVADSTVAIQAAFNSTNQKIVFPNGTYKISASLELDGKKYVEGFGNDVNTSVIRLDDSSVLEAIKVGSNAIFSGCIKNLVVQRPAYDGATENIGFAFYNIAGALIENVSSRLSKYNFMFKPQNAQRVAYNTFINISGVGGFYNMTGQLSGTGFVNENVFLGGRMFTSADTNTNVYFAFGGNHNRWIAMSCEGSGEQAFYLDSPGPSLSSHSNVIWNCRTEGTWSVDDVVLGVFTQRNTVDSRSLFTTVTDNGTNNTIFSTNLNKLTTADNGSRTLVVRRQGASNDIPALTVSDEFSSTGNSYGIFVESGRDTSGGYIIRGVRKSDGLERFSVTSIGSLFASRNLRAGQSAWNFEPLVLGTFVLWVDNSGRLRIKNGTPTSATDGTIVGTQT
jgi:hypothetical protein